MVSTLQYQVATYTVWWLKTYGGAPLQVYEAERRLRDLQRGTS